MFTTTRFPRLAFLLPALLLALGACSDDSDDRGPTGPGSRTGELAIWTRANLAGGIDVWLDGRSVGRLTMYYTSGTPTCGDQGTITVTRNAGRYTLEAETPGGIVWDTPVDVSAGECNLMELVYTGGAMRLVRTVP